MKKPDLLPADTYIVKNSTILNKNSDVLFKLYQPIIGSTAINFYLTLSNELDSMNIMSREDTHHNLMVKTRTKLSDLLEAREKLEALGLLKTYIKKGSINSYIYELYSPLEPKEFLENPILSVTLQNSIGKKEYENIISFYTLPNVDLKDYQDITTSFNETFDIKGTAFFSDNITNIKGVKQVDILINSKLDLNSVLSLIPDEYLNKESIGKETKSLIYKLAFIYNLSDLEFAELIRNSINDKRLIDNDLLRKNCQNYYNFEHSDTTLSLVYKKQPEYLRKEITSNSKREKMIYTFETTSPYDFLSGKNKGVKPTKKDLALLEELLIDYEFNPGVVNVLIDYVLKINDNKLTKNFVTAIAIQWKRSGIKTVKEAMDICIKENKGKKTIKKKTLQKEEKPQWYGKNIEQDEASLEEIKKLEEKLKK